MANFGFAIMSFSLRSKRFARFRQSTQNFSTGSPSSTWFDRMQNFFKERPYVANFSAALALDASADICCQMLQNYFGESPKTEEASEEQSPSTQSVGESLMLALQDLDIGRVLRMVVYGMIIVPIEVKWYSFVDSAKLVSFIKSSVGSGALRVACAKTVIDSGFFGAIMAPVFSLAMYTMKTIERESVYSLNISSAADYVKGQFFTLWASECVFWFVFGHRINGTPASLSFICVKFPFLSSEAVRMPLTHFYYHLQDAVFYAKFLFHPSAFPRPDVQRRLLYVGDHTQPHR